MSDAVAVWSAVGACAAAVGTVGTLISVVVSSTRLRKAALDDERIAQARKVFAWFEEISFEVILGNSSEESVYDIVLYLVWVQEAEPRTGEDAERLAGKGGPRLMRAIVRVLPPGNYRVEIDGPEEWPPPGLAHLGVEMAFTDSANRHWIRRADGRGLGRLASDPITHYVIPRPLFYSTLRDRGEIEGG